MLIRRSSANSDTFFDFGVGVTRDVCQQLEYLLSSKMIFSLNDLKKGGYMEYMI